MFGINSHKEMPPEFLTSYAAWDTYMSHLWATLLADLAYDEHMTVVEIAPGTSAKIGGALAELNFKGKLYVVEPLESALLVICDNYKTLLPDAEIYPINQTLIDSIKLLPQNADYILANHPLDDMIISLPFKDFDVFKWSLTPSSTISDKFSKLWLEMASDTHFVHSALKDIAGSWRQLIQELKPKTTIISQYPSDALDKSNLQDLNTYAWTILNSLKIDLVCAEDKDIQAILNQLENYNKDYIGNKLLNAKNWGVFHYK